MLLEVSEQLGVWEAPKVWFVYRGLVESGRASGGLCNAAVEARYPTPSGFPPVKTVLRGASIYCARLQK